MSLSKELWNMITGDAGSYKLQHYSAQHTQQKKKDACEFFLYFFKSIFFYLLLRTNDLNRTRRYDRSQKKA